MMKSGVFETTIYREDEEIRLVIEYSYSPGYPGCMYLRNGDPGYPPEPADVETHRITREGVEFSITDDEFEEIFDRIVEAEERACEDPRADRADYERDSKRDEPLIGRSSFLPEIANDNDD